MLNARWIPDTFEGKRTLGRNKSRWEDNIKMVAKEIGYGRRRMDLCSSEYRLMETVLNIRVP
jgi:hypothetical protein